MSNRRPVLTPRQIEALTLDDLLGDLDPSALAKAASTPTAPQRANLLNREADRERLIAQAAQRHRAARQNLTPWIPEAIVLLIRETHCSHCAAVWPSPAAESLMVRFRHRRTGDTWEVANHPSQLNPHLPLEKKVLHAKAHACPACFTSGNLLAHYRRRAEEQNPAPLNTPDTPEA